MNIELQKFKDLVDEHWDDVMRDHPIFASRTGDHRFNDRLGKTSESFYEKRIDKLSSLINRLEEINSDQFSDLDKLNYKILERKMKYELKGLEYRTYRMPISKLSGFHHSFPMIASFVPLNGLDDYNNFIARLHGMGKFIDETVEIMRAGLKDGQIPPRVTLEGVVDSIRKQIAQPIDSVYFKAFLNFPKSISKIDRKQLKQEGEKVITDVINPALDKFAKFLEEEYIPASRTDIAAINLPDGVNYYQYCINKFTTLDLSAQEIHDIGMEEVKRIRSEMEQIIKSTGFEGDFRQFVEFLRTDEQFYAKSAEELMQKTALVLKKIDGKLPEIFKTLPRLPYGIKKIPDYAAPGSTTAYYMPGTGDGTRSGTYFVNTYDLPSRPLYEVEALSLHEAVPGHHLQISLQMEIDLPKFRKFTGITAFVEGWGLYSERLGLETGFYQDNYSNFGRLSYEMWRATRLVVDTGMHALGWSRQQAIDFMMEYTSLSLLNVSNEVDRYIAWPGQALAYKMGELKIRELRAEAEKRLGNRFNIREFHDAILLNGSLPLQILDEHITQWITNQL